MYTDSHAHLTAPSVLPSVDAILARAKEHHVDKIVNICTDEKSLQEGLILAARYNWVFNAAATTPHDVEKEGESFFPLVESAAQAGKLIAIGETGLDYFYEHSDKKCQIAFLVRYFHLAKVHRLPLIIHCRDAFSDLFKYADAEYSKSPAVLHCFTGTLDEAKEVLKREWYLSLSGIITFKKAEALREVVAYVPLEHMLIETDTPYLAPQSNRGKQNEPAFIYETCALIASIKGVDFREVARITSLNATKFFSFPKHV